MGRVLTFADLEVIRMAKEDFIPLTGDDWYQRRRQDAEGEFFRKVADQGRPRDDGGTRQGIYVFTADGQLLAYRNHRDAAVMRGVFEQALKAWQKLPAERRRPGAVQVGERGKPDANYHREHPKGGLILNVYTRILDRKGEEYCAGTCAFTGGDQVARDHLWLTEQEWKALIPVNPRKGDWAALPKAVAYRIASFHLVDNTRGEPPHWSRSEIRKLTMTLTVEEVSDKAVSLKLEGVALLTTAADPQKATRGYDVQLLGRIRYDVNKQAIDRFDAVAVGDHWGEGTYTRGARPGRMPLGVAFELAKGDAPADRIPPQGARYLRGYLLADQE